MRKSLKKCIAVLLALVVLLAAMPAGMVSAQVTGNTYYVSTTGSDTADGSEASPFKTFAHAVDVLQPGDTLIIKQGDYSEAILLNGKTGTERAPITIRGEGKVNIFAYALDGYAWKDYTLCLKYCQYINISNLSLSFPPSDMSDSYNVVMYGSSNIKIQNCTIDGTYTGEYDADGYRLQCGPYAEFYTGWSNTNLTLDSNVVGGAGYSFYSGAIPNSTIVNNIFTDWGIFYWGGTTNSIISNNLFSADYTDAGVFYDGSYSNNILTNNIFLGRPAWVGDDGHWQFKLADNTCSNNYVTDGKYKTSGSDIVANPADVFALYDPDNWKYDYHLKPGSPCADTGTKQGLPAYDHDGVVRYGTPDIGPYAGGAMYYLDANAPEDGNGLSLATAFNSIDDVNKLNGGKGLIPGTPLFIKPGDYTGTLSVTGDGSAATEDINIEKLGDGVVKINGGSGPAISLTKIANVKIKGLTLTTDTGSAAFVADGAINCEVSESSFTAASNGMEIKGGTTGCKIFNNTYEQPDQNGILLNTSSKNKIYNNIFKDKTGISDSGRFSTTYIMNNLFINSGSNIVLKSADTGNIIENNIFNSATATAIDTTASTAFYTSTSNNKVDYNLYDSTSSLKEKPVNEVNSYCADPALTADYHPQFGSAVINRGTSTNAPVLDREGTVRYSKPDIGVYEYTGNLSTFSIDSMSPAKGATEVPLDSSIVIDVSEKTSEANYNLTTNNNLVDNIKVTTNIDGKTVNVPGTFSAADNATTGGTTITFDPTNPLIYDATYTVTVKKDLMSESGNYLPADTSWTFDAKKYISDKYFIAPNGSDANVGSIDSPKRTVSAKLIAKLQPGDTIYFREGSYNGIMVLQSKAGTADKPISIKSYNNEKVVLTSDHPDYILYLGHCQYINVEGLTFAPNASQNGSRGVSMYIDNHTKNYAQTKGIKISGCTFINCGTAASFRDLVDNGYGDFEFSNNTIYSDGGWGIYFQEVREIPGSYGKIFNNVIYGASRSINMWGRSTNLLFYNNTFADKYDPEGGSGEYDLYLTAGSYTPSINPVNISTDLVFKNNIFTKPIYTQLQCAEYDEDGNETKPGKTILDASQNCTFDNNVYSINGTDRLTYGGGGAGSPELTFAELQAYQDRDLEKNGKAGSVTFANVLSDARILLSTNPAIGAGASEIKAATDTVEAVTAPAADIDGNTWYNKEAGAYAFDSALAFVGANTTGTADGTPEHPYATIAAAIGHGMKNIQVIAGTYNTAEGIDMSSAAGNVTVTPYGGKVVLNGALNITGDAVNSFAVKNITLAGNTSVSGDKVTIEGCDVTGSVNLNGANGAVVSRNIFAPKAADAITLSDSANCVITNNVITERQSAVKLTSSNSNMIYNNTFYKNAGDIVLSASTGNTIKNNIISTMIESFAGNTFSYNLYNSDTISSGDLAAITADTNAVKASPMFINEKAKDYRIYKGSPCAMKGNTDENSPAVDITGITRNSPPDIGAYAVTAIENNYYVDGAAGSDTNSGIATSPFKTIGAALNVLRSGEGVIVKAGTYNETISLTDRAGQENNDYVISADGAVTVKGIALNNSTGVTIKGFTVAAGAENTAVSVNASPKTVLSGLTIADAKIGVNAVASPDLSINKVSVKNVENGFVIDGSNVACPVTISQSKVDNASVAAIVANNAVSLNLNTSIISNSKEGLVGAGQSSFAIVNNTFYNNSGYSIDVTQNAGNDTQLDILNNIFSRSSRGGGAFNNINKTMGFYSEYNLYDANATDAVIHMPVINDAGEVLDVDRTLADANADGYEITSLLGNPLFKSAATGDFNLLKTSPAARKGTQKFGLDTLADGSSFEIAAPAVDNAGTTFSSHGQDIGALYTPYSLKVYNLAGDGAGKDNGDGSINAPFRNFADALKAMDSADTIIVHKGVYKGRNDIYNMHGVADANCIIKACDDPNCAICKAADPNGTLPGPVFTGKNDWTNKEEKVYNYETMSHLVNCSNVTIEGLYVTGFHGAGLWADDSDSITFKNLNIWDIDNPEAHNSGVEGILLGSTSNSLFKDINIWDIGQTIKSQADHGIYAGGLSNCTFENIKVSNSPGGGFQFYHGDNYNIHSTNCTIKNCVFSESNMGLILCGLDGFKIINNTFYNSWNMDLYLDWNVRNCVFENNVFYNGLAEGRDDPTWGNFTTPSVINYQWSTLKENDDKTTTEMVVNNTFKNNMIDYVHFAPTGSIRGEVSPILTFMADETASDKGNVYTNNLLGYANFKGTLDGVTDEYQKAQLIFDNITDLSGNSSCIDAGAADYAPTADILGRTRDSKPDIGAYECPEADKAAPVVVTPPPATVTPTPVPTVTPTPTPGAEPQFSDIEGNWAMKAIMDMAKAGVLTGYSDGTARPNANATRAEFVTFITKLMKAESNTAVDFSDINTSAWYMKYLSAAVEKGWIKGRTDGSFAPNSSITREEAFAIISRIIDSLGVTSTIDTSALDAYTDKDSISAWAKNDMAKLVGLGIIQGSNSKLNPKAEITRAEICAILDRVMEKYLNK